MFARLILLDGTGVLARIAKVRSGSPIYFAAACGLALVLIGLASDGNVYGTGYDQARAI